MDDTTTTRFTFDTPYGHIDVTADTQEQAEVQLEFVLIEYNAALAAISQVMKDNNASISPSNVNLKGDASWMN